MNDTLLAAEAAGAPVSSGGEPVRLSPRLYRLALAAIILLGYGAMVVGFWGDIRHDRFHDPDDFMRLQQVRDWLAGQSWFDVSQYRVNPPHGLPMHWSRLLDVPIGASILLFRPFTGQPTAELIACVIVPFLTFAALAALIARIARQVSGSAPLALLAAAFCAADAGTYALAHPMRIDHHGWQAVCALAMVTALLGERSWRRAAIAGGFAALWMHISLEGIVFTAACGAWLGLRWALDPDREGPTLTAYLAGVTVASLSLFLIAHGGALFDRTFCDAVSPIHMALFAMAALGAALTLRLGRVGLAVRLGLLGLTALACAATYKLSAPQCGGGAFSMLTPLDYNLWYRKVAEGQPIWHESLTTILTWIAFPLVGLATGLAALRSPERRTVRTDYVALLGAAIAVSIFVLRAGAVSNILAIPGALLALRAVSRHIQAIRRPALRVPAQAAATLLLMPLAPAVLATLLIPAPADEARAADAYRQCIDFATIRRLDLLPPSLIMADLDFGSAIIAGSHQSVVAASYHRAPLAMDDDLRFFTGNAAQARAIAARRHIGFVYFCPEANAARGLAQAAPHGIAAQLIAGHPPVWLQPVALPGLGAARVYRFTG